MEKPRFQNADFLGTHNSRSDKEFQQTRARNVEYMHQPSFTCFSVRASVSGVGQLGVDNTGFHIFDSILHVVTNVTNRVQRSAMKLTKEA